MVLIPEEKTDYRGIGIIEVMYKVVAVILNCQLRAYITFDGLLHEFGLVVSRVLPPLSPNYFSS